MKGGTETETETKAQPQKMRVPSAEEFAAMSNRTLFRGWQATAKGPRHRGFEQVAGAYAVEIIRRFGKAACSTPDFRHSVN